MKKWYFTFGLAQYKLAKKYLCLEAPTETEARSLMTRMFGLNWGVVYSEEDWNINKGTNNWDMYVKVGKIPDDATYDSTSLDQIFELTELKL